MCIFFSRFILCAVVCLQISQCTKSVNYFNQKPPGKLPEVFAPDIISQKYNVHGSLVFSHDGRSCYFSHVTEDFQQGKIMIMEYEDDHWGEPQKIFFSYSEYRDLCPALTTDDKKLFFTSLRPVEEGKIGYNLWSVQRNSAGWSDPLPVGPPVNTGCESGCSVGKNGTLYFMSWKSDDPMTCDLYRSTFRNGHFSEPEIMGDQINSDLIETTPFISPDDTYILFSSLNRPDGKGGFDLYVSFRNRDGSWSKSKNLGVIVNSEQNDWFPSVSPDGKYIFYISGRSGQDEYYWIDAEIIEKLKQSES